MHRPFDQDKMLRGLSENWAADEPFPQAASSAATSDPGPPVLLFNWTGQLIKLVGPPVRILPPCGRAELSRAQSQPGLTFNDSWQGLTTNIVLASDCAQWLAENPGRAAEYGIERVFCATLHAGCTASQAAALRLRSSRTYRLPQSISSGPAPAFANGRGGSTAGGYYTLCEVPLPRLQSAEPEPALCEELAQESQSDPATGSGPDLCEDLAQESAAASTPDTAAEPEINLYEELAQESAAEPKPDLCEDLAQESAAAPASGLGGILHSSQLVDWAKALCTSPAVHSAAVGVAWSTILVGAGLVVTSADTQTVVGWSLVALGALVAAPFTHV